MLAEYSLQQNFVQYDAWLDRCIRQCTCFPTIHRTNTTMTSQSKTFAYKWYNNEACIKQEIIQILPFFSPVQQSKDIYAGNLYSVLVVLFCISAIDILFAFFCTQLNCCFVCYCFQQERVPDSPSPAPSLEDGRRPGSHPSSHRSSSVSSSPARTESSSDRIRMFYISSFKTTLKNFFYLLVS